MLCQGFLRRRLHKPGRPGGSECQLLFRFPQFSQHITQFTIQIEIQGNTEGQQGCCENPSNPDAFYLGILRRASVSVEKFQMLEAGDIANAPLIPLSNRISV